MSQMTAIELLSIGAFARRSRLSIKALRLYDELGLLTPAAVDPWTSYRSYSEDQVARARLIGLLRRLDMPLGRIALVLDLPADRAITEVAAFWAEVEASVEVKKRLVAHLERHLGGRGEVMYEVSTRSVPEQRVVSRQRALHVKGLPAFIDQAHRELYEHLSRAGARAIGPSFVVYYGEVNEDSDGPVEVCVPFTGDFAQADGPPVRIEPAHEEAYTTITLAQCEFPVILEAYEAVERWIKENGRSTAAACREVYFVDESRVGPDDPFCDIAFPLA